MNGFALRVCRVYTLGMTTKEDNMNNTLENNGTYTITYCPGTVRERQQSFDFAVTDWNPNPEVPSLIKIELHEYDLPAPHNVFYARKTDAEISWK